MKYKIVGLEDLKDTICRYTEVNHNFNTQLLIIISDLPTPKFACNVLVYFKDGGPKLICKSQNALHATDSDT